MKQQMPISYAVKSALMILMAFSISTLSAYGESSHSFSDSRSTNTAQPERAAIDPLTGETEAGQSTVTEGSKSIPSAQTFLMEEDALSEATPEENKRSMDRLLNDRISLQNSIAQIPPPRFKENFRTPEILFPVSQSCSVSDSNSGNATCRKVYSNGSISESHTQSELAGKEFRQITTIEEADANSRLTGLKSIYQGTQYSDLDQNIKEFEFFEITHEEENRPRSKEILIYDFYPGTNQIKKVTWGKYEQSHPQADEKLTSHAFLTYHADGTPNKGLAENLEDGYLTAQFLTGRSSASEPQTSLEQESWKGWENWITTRRLSLYVS